MSEHILEAIDTRDKFVKVKKDHDNYKLRHNTVVSLIHNAKRDYYISIIEKCTSNSKFWIYLSELDAKSSAPPPLKLNDGETEGPY